MSDQRAEVAHVLRRTTFGPFPGQVDAALAAHGSVDELIEAQLAAAPLPFDPSVLDPTLPDGGAVDIDHPPVEQDLRYYAGFRRWWPARMRRDDAGLHDRMMWFWHTHFTSSFTKIDNTTMCWDQMRLLHRHALGNFGDLAKAITLDRAMLRYLDGAGSNPGSPNENYARELMELFTLGVDRYEQADVVTAARVFAGWQVSDRSELQFPDPTAVVTEPMTFLGTTKVFDIDSIVDEILAHDACAPFVASRLWRTFVGGPVEDDAIEAWADTFRSSGYEIAPLMAEVLRSDQFRRAVRTRARTPVEWHSAMVRAAELPIDDAGGLTELGQTPYGPPDPSGWPGDSAWLSPSHVRAKVRLISQLDPPAADALASADDLVAAVLAQCSLEDLGDESRAVLDTLAADLAADASVSGRDRAAAVLWAAVMTPEFSLA